MQGSDNTLSYSTFSESAKEDSKTMHNGNDRAQANFKSSPDCAMVVRNHILATMFLKCGEVILEFQSN